MTGTRERADQAGQRFREGETLPEGERGKFTSHLVFGCDTFRSILDRFLTE